MIIRRYIASQVLLSTLAVASVLTVILMSGRVIRYFGMAADGRMDVSLLTAVLVYRLPQFLELIVPLGMFIAILLTFGRLYIDNEMSVLSASGVSRGKIVGFLALPVAMVMLLVAGTSLYVTPAGNKASEELFAKQANSNTFDLVKPGKFQRAGDRMLYAEALSPDKKELLNVLLYEQRPAKGEQLPRQSLVYAEHGRRYVDEASKIQYLELRNGTRYELNAGERAYNELRFARYTVRLPDTELAKEITKTKALSTPQVLAKRGQDREAEGELMWRLSMPALVPVVALLAFPLSRVNPRQGRYLKLLPAILLYMSYVVMIAAAKNGIEKGKLSEAAVWGVHFLYLALALLLLGWEQIRLRWQKYRAEALA